MSEKSTMKTNFHGLSSLVLFGAAIIIAHIALFLISIGIGFAYMVLCVFASIAIIALFCGKCADREQCGHIIPGKLAKYLKTRPGGPYTLAELVITGLAFLMLAGFPQIWLWRFSGLFVLYWVLNIVALVQVRTVMCRVCGNQHCPGKRL